MVESRSSQLPELLYFLPSRTTWSFVLNTKWIQVEAAGKLESHGVPAASRNIQKCGRLVRLELHGFWCSSGRWFRSGQAHEGQSIKMYQWIYVEFIQCRLTNVKSVGGTLRGNLLHREWAKSDSWREAGRGASPILQCLCSFIDVSFRMFDDAYVLTRSLTLPGKVKERWLSWTCQ